jgi:hypothetical protein
MNRVSEKLKLLKKKKIPISRINSWPWLKMK